MAIRFARSARRHRVSRESVLHVIEHCGLRFEQSPPRDNQYERTTRLVFLGDDVGGVALEVLAVEQANGDLFVIHAMPLRERFRPRYQEAAKWRK